MARANLSNGAQAELEEILGYIAEDNPQAAEALLERMNATFRRLAERPLSGRAREEFGRSLRSAPVGDYLIFYRPMEDGVQILHVVHGARNLRKILGE